MQPPPPVGGNGAHAQSAGPGIGSGVGAAQGSGHNAGGNGVAPVLDPVTPDAGVEAKLTP